MKRALIASFLMLFFIAPGALGESAELVRMISAIEPMALGETFEAMKPSEVEEAAGILGSAYEFTGRVSESGRYAYLAGTLKDGASPPRIEAITLGFDERTEVKMFLPTGGYDKLEQFNGFVSNGDGSIVYFSLAGAPGSLAKSVREFFKPDGEARILEMAARGVSLEIPISGPFARIWLYTDTGTKIEYFLLDEETAAGFKKQKKLDGKDEGFYGIDYSMEPSDSSNNDYNVEYDYSAPVGLLELAQQKCNYVLIRKFPAETPVKAELALLNDDGEATTAQIVEDRTQLKKLVSIIRRSKPTGGGKHGFNARLTLSYADGSNFVLYKAIDRCPEIIVGSYMIRGLTKKDAATFDNIFAEAWKERLDELNKYG